MRLLLVEDDDKAASYLKRGLMESGYIVDHAADGELGQALAEENIYDALIVDRLLPKRDGLDMVKALREKKIAVPIMMLSALANPLDRVEGLRAGCDDYLAKPYSFAELVARIEAITKRAGGAPPDGQTIIVGDLVLDLRQRVARRKDLIIDLQFREFLLLQMLMRNAGAVVTRSMLLEAGWDYAFEPRGSIVDMHIHRIRKKIGDTGDKSVIRTIAGAGYMMERP